MSGWDRLLGIMRDAQKGLPQEAPQPAPEVTPEVVPAEVPAKRTRRKKAEPLDEQKQ